MTEEEKLLAQAILAKTGTGGGGGGGSTSPADIAQGIDDSADIDTMLTRLLSIIGHVDGIEILLGTLNTNIASSSGKLERIKGAANYTAVVTYIGATTDVNSVTHTGTTPLGVEVLVETFTYDGLNRLTNIVYS